MNEDLIKISASFTNVEEYLNSYRKKMFKAGKNLKIKAEITREIAIEIIKLIIISKLETNTDMEHELKILPQYFEQVWNGNKTFELREDDRNYKVGDKLRLLEFDYGTYTGRECNRKISYILKDVEQYGLKKGFVILAIT